MNELALFAGAGGGILGGVLLGWRTVCAVELDAYARRVLLARQRDGCLPRFPIWDDGRPWRGRVDVISGGFPCTDISCAGKGAGITGKHSGLWKEMARIVGEVGPRYVFVENSPMLTSRGLGRVLGDLATMGYDARWGVLGAVHAGAPHRRLRIWIVAHANGGLRDGRPDEPGRKAQGGVAVSGSREEVSHAQRERLERIEQGRAESRAAYRPSHGSDRSWWAVEPNVGRVAHGVAHRVDRIRALGNGQVPSVAAMAWRILSVTS